MNVVRPSLVQSLSLTAALEMQFLNASCLAGGTRFCMQFTNALLPEDCSSEVAPTLLMQASTCAFAFSTAADVPVDVAVGVAVLVFVAPPVPLVVVVLLQLVAAKIASEAAAASTCAFPDITNPPV